MFPKPQTSFFDSRVMSPNSWVALLLAVAVGIVGLISIASWKTSEGFLPLPPLRNTVVDSTISEPLYSRVTSDPDAPGYNAGGMVTTPAYTASAVYATPLSTYRGSTCNVGGWIDPIFANRFLGHRYRTRTGGVIGEDFFSGTIVGSAI